MSISELNVVPELGITDISTCRGRQVDTATTVSAIVVCHRLRVSVLICRVSLD